MVPLRTFKTTFSKSVNERLTRNNLLFTHTCRGEFHSEDNRSLSDLAGFDNFSDNSFFFGLLISFG